MDASNVDSPDATDDEGGLIANTLDAVTDLVTETAIPKPIKRNLFKAFGQLCTAAIDVPVAYLEGVAAEKRAESQARIKIIATSGDQISQQLDVDPDYARIAVKKYGEKIIREQINLDSVSEVAAEEIRRNVAEETSQPENDAPPISEDWLNEFEKEASQKSTEEMQQLFGRILAGEIQRPSSFSIRTLKLVGELDSRAARRFQQLCSLCISVRAGEQIVDARVPSLTGNAGRNSLQEYGLSFDQLNLLHEYGLIIPDYNSYFDYRFAVANADNATIGFHHQSGLWGLIPKGEWESSSELRVHGVALSRAGRELSSVVDLVSADTYTTALGEYFDKRGFKMVPAIPPEVATVVTTT